MIVMRWRVWVESKYLGALALGLVAIGEAKHELAPIVEDVCNGFVVGGKDASGRDVEGKCKVAVLCEEVREPLIGCSSGLWMAEDGYA